MEIDLIRSQYCSSRDTDGFDKIYGVGQFSSIALTNTKDNYNLGRDLTIDIDKTLVFQQGNISYTQHLIVNNKCIKLNNNPVFTRSNKILEYKLKTNRRENNEGT